MENNYVELMQKAVEKYHSSNDFENSTDGSAEWSYHDYCEALNELRKVIKGKKWTLHVQKSDVYEVITGNGFEDVLYNVFASCRVCEIKEFLVEE